MISAIYGLALSAGGNRVVTGVRIEHVVGDPGRGEEKGYALGLQIMRAAMRALSTEISEPTLFRPAATDTGKELESA
jgi:hypothetical protein